VPYILEEANVRRIRMTRRRFVTGTAATTAAAIAAPYVHTASAAGSLTLGLWDHWVPGANDTCTKIINEWAEREKVDVKVDYITAQGNKLLLTVAAEAQASAGHDVLMLSNWLPSEHN
jgi:ABC-type glycerol-3-phosphate transport system substrate-binding protein